MVQRFKRYFWLILHIVYVLFNQPFSIVLPVFYVVSVNFSPNSCRFLVLSFTGFSLGSLLGRKLLKTAFAQRSFIQRTVYTKQLLRKTIFTYVYKTTKHKLYREKPIQNTIFTQNSASATQVLHEPPLRNTNFTQRTVYIHSATCTARRGFQDLWVFLPDTPLSLCSSLGIEA